MSVMRTTLVVVALLAGCTQAPEPAPPQRPNIIYILADDLGYGEVGCYGQQKIRTPNIDRLAAEGMRFSDAYSGGAVCAPTRSTIMSGLHTGHSPVRANGGGNPLLPDDPTVASVLREAGYRAAGFGKWGLGDIGTTGVPWDHGFDEFFGYLHQVHAHFFYPEYLWRNSTQYPLEGNRREKAEGIYSADVIHEQAMGFLRNHVRQNETLRAQSSGARDEPFFLYLAYTPPHGEYQVPEDSLVEYRGQFEEKLIEARGEHDAQPEPFAAYAGMITRLDRQVGEVLSAVDELGIAEDTLVIFTSDNGPSPPHNALELFNSAGALRGRKGTLWEGGIRAPFIARWSGRIAPGTESNLPTASWDFLPTAAELAQGSLPSNIDGVSIVPTLLGEGEQQRHEYLYWEHPGGDLERDYRAVRMDHWKAIRDGNDLRLYDLTADIGETQDVADANPDIAERMSAIMSEAHTEPRPHFRKGWTP